MGGYSFTYDDRDLKEGLASGAKRKPSRRRGRHYANAKGLRGGVPGSPYWSWSWNQNYRVPPCLLYSDELLNNELKLRQLELSRDEVRKLKRTEVMLVPERYVGSVRLSRTH
jgi:hypothetical protein